MIASLIALAGVALLQSVPYQGEAACGVEPSSIVSRSPAGLAQVSNLALLHMRVSAPPRRVPPDGTLQGLRAEAMAYRIERDGARTVVPSKVNATGSGGDTRAEYVVFDLDIPIDPAERDAAIRDYQVEMRRAAELATSERERAMAVTVQTGAAVATIYRQHRTGRFHVECRVVDDGRMVASGAAEFEVLFKGRFFDQPGFRVK